MKGLAGMRIEIHFRFCVCIGASLSVAFTGAALLMGCVLKTRLLYRRRFLIRRCLEAVSCKLIVKFIDQALVREQRGRPCQQMAGAR